MDIKDLNEEQMAELKLIKDGLRVSKVVATRAVKTRNGDFFVGMSAAWDTRQEDAGGMGTDLTDALDDNEQHAAIMTGGMTMKQARVAAAILGMQVDIQATGHALGGGAISKSEHDNAVRAIKRNYSQIIAEAVAGKQTNGDG